MLSFDQPEDRAAVVNEVGWRWNVRQTLAR
jgi:hypothetical protein